MLGLVVNRASMQLARDLGGRAAADAPVETAQWLAAPARARARDNDWWQAVQYLADNASAANAPFALSAVQRQRAHASVPLISSARRVAVSMGVTPSRRRRKTDSPMAPARASFSMRAGRPQNSVTTSATLMPSHQIGRAHV